MESELLSIGQLARASGLTVSALRFYDGAGVLVPVLVDPVTGYRWYTERQVRSARLVARLRRVGMPLACIVDVLRHWPEPVEVRRLLDEHLRRLQDGLADARRELSRVDALLDSEENTMTDTTGRHARLTVRGADLAAALRAVRFAVCRDPELPALCGVLLDLEATGDEAVLRLVATDRYRMAVAGVPVTGMTGTPLGAIAPTGLVDLVYALVGAGPEGAVPDSAGSEGAVTLVIGPSEIAVTAAGRQVSGAAVDGDFPDFRRLLRTATGAGPAHRATVRRAALRDALASTATRPVLREMDGVMCDVSVLTTDGDSVTVAPGDSPDGVGVNREFLLEAMAAVDADQLTLELDGPIKPLAVRVPGDDRTFSILMPTRLSAEAA